MICVLQCMLTLSGWLDPFRLERLARQYISIKTFNLLFEVSGRSAAGSEAMTIEIVVFIVRIDSPCTFFLLFFASMPVFRMKDIMERLVAFKG